MTHALPPDLAGDLRNLSDELAAVVARAFLDGHRRGSSAAREQVAAFVSAALRALEQRFESLGAAEIASFESAWRGAEPSPVIAAYTGAAADVLHQILSELTRMANESGTRFGDAE